MKNKVAAGSTVAVIMVSMASVAIFLTANSAVEASTAETRLGYVPEKTRSLSVVGTANAKVVPDQINISFAVENQEETALLAAENNARITNAIIEALKNAGVSDQELGTSFYSVYPVYEYVDVPTDCIEYREGDQNQKYCPPPTLRPVLVGYKAVNSVQVQSEQLDKAGQWIDAAVRAGANRVENLYFTVSAERQDEIRHGLISDAVQNARSKAVTAVDAMGMEIVDVLSVNIDSYPIIYQKRGYEYSAGAPSSQTSIIAGVQEVSVNVPVIFEISGFVRAPAGSNSTIEAKINERFNVTLTSNPSTGYQWRISGIDETVARLVDERYIAPDSNLVGAAGKQVLTFEALKEGKTIIELEYVRPWDQENPASIYTIDLAVSSG